LVLTDYLIGVTNLALKPDEQTFHIINIQNLYQSKHTRQSEKFCHLSTRCQENVKWEYRYGVNKEPSLYVAFRDFLEFKNNLLFFNISKSLEPGQDEVEVEERFNYPVGDEDGIMLLKIEGIVQNSVDAGVCDEDQNEYIENRLPHTVWMYD